ncbi:MAG: ABC transporter permease [Cytophagaceae bacterium]|nr:ABC transporter permease [Gemmatimonadaceae bacterium]
MTAARNWRRLLRLPGVDEVDAELRFHLQAMVDANVAKGMAPGEALARARAEFGDAAAAAALCREIDRQLDRRRRIADTLGNIARDVRQAARALRRSPSYTITALSTLALGVAATTAAFTLVFALFLRPFPFPAPADLLDLNTKAPKWNLERVGLNYPDFHAWRASATTSFAGMALLSSSTFNLSDGTTAERVDGAYVTRDFPAVLGVPLLAGRTFSEEEDRPNGPSVVMISRSLWQGHFNGSASAIGRTLVVHGRTATIVGVLPDEGAFIERAKVYMPYAGDPAQVWQSYDGEAVARLRPGVTIEAARAELLHAHEPIWAARDTARFVTPTLTPLHEVVTAPFAGASRTLAVATALILLIAVANVTSVMLARAVVRQRETGIRKALGATAARVAQQVLAETLVLAALAGVIGTLVGHWSLQLLLRALPDQFPGWAHFGFSMPTALFATVLVALASVASGIAPIVFGRKADARAAIGEATPRTTLSRRQRRLLDGLVVFEVAMCVVLLAVGGVLVQGYTRLQGVDPGFRAERTLAFNLSLPAVTYDTPVATVSAWERLLADIRAIPGVAMAGAISCRPLGCHAGKFTDVEGRQGVAGEATPVTLTLSATAASFDALGVTLAHGRTFRDEEGQGGRPVSVVVSEGYARWAWPAVADPTGRRIRPAGSADSVGWWSVVGVARDVRHYGLDQEPRPTINVPWTLAPPRNMAVVVHASGETDPLVAPLRAAVTKLDPTLPVYQLTTLDAALTRSLGLVRTTAWLLAVFAFVALLLAIGGLYGVLSYTVSRQRRDIGIRMALGASRSAIQRAVVGHVVVLVSIGVALGVPAVLAAQRLGARFLSMQAAPSWGVLLVAALVVLVAGAGSAFAPARRAVRFEGRGVLAEE